MIDRSRQTGNRLSNTRSVGRLICRCPWNSCHVIAA